MKGISVTQPWAWAILNAGKDIENRDWLTSYRGQIAIHAPKTCTIGDYESACNYIRRIVPNAQIPAIEDLPLGAIVGLARLTNCVDSYSCTDNSPWFQGDYGLVLRDVRLLATPIPCRGQLKLWDVPIEIETLINQQLLGRV